MITNETMIKKYVLIIKGNVCDLNGKDPNATVLLEKAKLYGDVVDFDTCVSALKAEYNEQYNELKARYDAIKALNLSEREKQLVALFRKLETEATATVTAEADKAKAIADAENAALRKQLEDVKAEQENRVAKIMAALA